MRKIWKFLKAHVSADFHGGHYTTIGLLLAAGLVFNYTLDFEDGVLEQLQGFPRLGGYFALYAFFYYLSVVSICYWKKRTEVLGSKKFWIRSFFAITLLSIDSSAAFLTPIVNSLVPPELYLWTFKVAINLGSFVIVFVPILLFYAWFGKNDPRGYGLGELAFDARPYFMMLALMLPLIVGASFFESFLRQYPMYRDGGAHEFLNVPEIVTVAGYELAYGLDFITVELLFRGFLVLGLFSVLGRDAVLSMAVVYCTLHFGKPPGEAVSSIAGGYLLGVIALETRSIWGGVIVHMGIAWLMELTAFLQKLTG